MRYCERCGSSAYYAKGKCKICYYYDYSRKTDVMGKKISYYYRKNSKTEDWNIRSRKAMTKMRAKRYFNMSPEEYKKLTPRCYICGFDIIVQLHHKDKNKMNNDWSNLIPLCPNHHMMAHMNLIKFDKKDTNNQTTMST